MLKDQLGNIISLKEKPQRIISVVPSQTELLSDLGLDKEVVGITKFCVKPNQWFQSKTRIGGTKKLNFEQIKALKPDLIIANKEENTKEEIEKLQNEYNVYVSDIYTLEDVYQMISDLGIITDCTLKANKIIQTIQSDFKLVKGIFNHSCAYFIWRNPYMVAANNTFIQHVLNHLGFHNIFKDKTRYPVVNQLDITNQSPEYLLLSSEPYPFKDKHIQELQDLCPNAKIILVDGEMFSWPGSRLMHAPKYFKTLKSTFSEVH